MGLTEQIITAALRGAANTLHGIATAIEGEHDNQGHGCVGCSVTATPASQAEPAPSIAEHTWEPKFAVDVQKGALLALDGRVVEGVAGLRAMRVTGRRSEERTLMFGSTSEVLTFLVMDVDSDEGHSFTTLPGVALQVAIVFEVPDSLGAES